MFRVSKKDVVLFPFSDRELRNGGLEDEYFVYSNLLGLDCIDEAEKPSNGFQRHLIIVGHGSQSAAHRQFIGGGKSFQRRVTDVAKTIATLGFPNDRDHEILVWSCHSGGVGGFAQLLALHLTSHGYSGIKVWGCNCYAGTINRHLRLTGRETEGGKNVKLDSDDLDYWIGV